MEFCPHCGDEIKTPVTYCPRCNELLERDMPTRDTVSEHLNYGIEVVKHNPSILAPQIILGLASMIFSWLFTKTYGSDVVLELQTALLEGGDLTPYIPLFKLTAAYILVGTFFDMLIQPFIQHVYVTATREEGVDFGASYSYVLGRISEFIVAQLIVIAIPVSIVLGIIGSLSNESLMNIDGVYSGVVLVSFVLIIVFFFMLSGIQIMVWEGTGFMDSFRLAVVFFKDRFWMLIKLGIVMLIIGGIVGYMPLSQYYNFLPNIFFGIVEIDVFLNYRKMKR
ncbi:zinc ribbon domain-containing protein [Candidatus Bathyarchaeota archaeon]|jgi:hypothetical protein|nr:zinc ribbon domain-containing protein [Candidatus Bathyarchaeota archaeon]MBT4424190.1 zinc ribbon domain-containing protein [Candidatus Bathyarchaeota archaeon]MBT7187645.1 zinc ribbon domain-containing protein [Candidatus Bathyarchaeota archaeon]MBT7347228.1 zinc ribbon domain-containing protein [Candidatus Bathyarchaeota archaeon]